MSTYSSGASSQVLLLLLCRQGPLQVARFSSSETRNPAQKHLLSIFAHEM